MSSAKGFQHYVLYHGLVLTRTILNYFKKTKFGKAVVSRSTHIIQKNLSKPLCAFSGSFLSSAPMSIQF